MEVGHYIKQLRGLLQISARELAGSNLNQNMIYGIESRRLAVTPVTAMALARNFNKIAEAKGLNLDVEIDDFLIAPKDRLTRLLKKEVSELRCKAKDENVEKQCIHILERANQWGCEEVKYEALEILGDYYGGKGKIEQAAEYFSQCLDYYKGNKYREAFFLNKLGKNFHAMDLEKAFLYYMQAYEKVKEANQGKDADLKAKIIYNVALAHAIKGQNGATGKYLEELNKLEILDRGLLVRVMLLEASFYLNSKEYTLAVEKYKGILEQESENVKPYEYIVLNNLSICYEHLDEGQSSLEYLEKSIKLQLQRSTPDITASLLTAAKLSERLNNKDSALKYLEEALCSAKEYQQFDRMLDCYHMMYRIYKAMNKMDGCKDIIQRCREVLEEKELEEKYHYRNQLIAIDYELFCGSVDKTKEALNEIILSIGK